MRGFGNLAQLIVGVVGFAAVLINTLDNYESFKRDLATVNQGVNKFIGSFDITFYTNFIFKNRDYFLGGALVICILYIFFKDRY